MGHSIEVILYCSHSGVAKKKKKKKKKKEKKNIVYDVKLTRPRAFIIKSILLYVQLPDIVLR